MKALPTLQTTLRALKAFRRMGRQLGRYVLTGAAGLGVSLAVTVLMREGAGLSAEAAFAVALAVVFAFQFFANAFFVFESGADRNTLLRYAGSALVFRLSDFLLFAGLQGLVAPYYAAVALAILITNLVKFLVYRRFVFTGRSRDGRAATRADGNPTPPPAPRWQARAGRTCTGR